MGVAVVMKQREVFEFFSQHRLVIDQCVNNNQLHFNIYCSSILTYWRMRVVSNVRRSHTFENRINAHVLSACGQHNTTNVKQNVVMRLKTLNDVRISQDASL